MKIAIRLAFTLSLLIAGLLPLAADGAATSRPIVYRIDIRRPIDRTAQIGLARGLDEAQRIGAAAVLIHLNTYGGLLEAADSMRTAILYSRVPVYVFIDNNAASAGALISIACKRIYMRRGSSIGAATAVDETGQAMPDKYQSYMRSMMRTTAQAHGCDTVIEGGDTTLRWLRDPLIAEAMVDDRIAIPNLIDSGKTLTLTTDEALKWGYCNGVAETVDEVIETHLGFADYASAGYELSWLDRLKGFLMNPAVQSVLILIIIGGIYFELQTPGVGFPLAAAITAGILYFAPLYLEGLAQHWEIWLFIAGLILIAIELFAIPGFGAAGIVGIVSVMAGFFLSLVDNTAFDFGPVGASDATRAMLTVMVGVILASALVVWLSSRIGNRGALHRAALTTDLEQAVASPVLTALVGQTGTTVTVLRPSGKVMVGGTLYDAVSIAGFIEADTAVRIVRFENAQLYVEPLTA